MAKNGKKNGHKPDPAPAKDERKEEFRRNLRVILTPSQVAERADRAAHLMSERDTKEEMAKAAQKHAKSEIDEIEAQMRRLSAEVRDKACYVETKCERIFDYRLGKVTEVRTDTGEVIDERTMTAEERQMAFNPPPKKPEDGDDDGKGAGGGLDDDFGDEHPEP